MKTARAASVVKDVKRLKKEVDTRSRDSKTAKAPSVKSVAAPKTAKSHSKGKDVKMTKSITRKEVP